MNAAVDTDVVSFIFKRDSRAAFYEAHLIGLVAAISFMTLAELDRWTLRRNWGPAKKTRLDRIISSFTLILPDRDLCRLWAEVTLACRKVGRPIETADAWVAATALQLGVPLLTHNRSDFAAVPGLTIISAAP
jgi:tRNA(fMet)-specific endonuclease VapC